MELIELEVIPVPKRTRKKKLTLEEQFKDIPTRIIVADTLSEEERTCSLCGTAMVPIGAD